MLNGLYSSATSLDVLSRKQEATASNLAHLNTPGHRRMIFSTVERTEAGEGSNALPGTSIGKQAADFSEGRREPTGRKLDLALKGDGFFVYQGKEGNLYSRNGVLYVNPDTNELVNSDGLPILGEGGPITVQGFESDFVFGADGTLTINGDSVGKLSVVQFEDNRLLESENQTYFRAGTAQPTATADDFSVIQGTRELSNGSPVNEMISLIIGSRQFEAAQRAIRTISDAIQENVRS